MRRPGQSGSTTLEPGQISSSVTAGTNVTPALILGLGEGQQCYQQAGLNQVPHYSWSRSTFFKVV